MKAATEDVGAQIDGLEELADLVYPLGRDGGRHVANWQSALIAGAPAAIESAVLTIACNPDYEVGGHDLSNSDDLLNAVSQNCFSSAVTELFDMLTVEVKAQLPAKVSARPRRASLRDRLAAELPEGSKRKREQEPSPSAKERRQTIVGRSLETDRCGFKSEVEGSVAAQSTTQQCQSARMIVAVRVLVGRCWLVVAGGCIREHFPDSAKCAKFQRSCRR